MAFEAVLLVLLAEQWGQAWSMKLPIPRWSKVMLVMALLVGAFGLLVRIAKRTSRRGISTIHGVSSLMLVPHVLVHVGVLAGIYWLWADFLGLWPVWR